MFGSNINMFGRVSLLFTLCFVCVLCADNVGIKTKQFIGLQNPIGLARPLDYYGQNNATADAQSLHDAVIGLGTDEEVIVNVLANRTWIQRQIIMDRYANLFNQSLIQDLKSDSSGHFRSVVKALLMDPASYIARQLNKALTSFISDDHAIAEILCTRHRDELIPVMNAYKESYNKTLISEIDECLDGDQRTFLKAILTDPIRDRYGSKNIAITTEQLEAIPTTADYCTVSQNRRLKEILSKESFEQIRQIAALHEKNKHKSVEDQLKRWCADDLLLEDYLTVVRFGKDSSKYYAEELYTAMEGLGTNDNKLKRIIISRSEVDLRDIKVRYQMLYNRTLVSSVEDETSGFYKKILVRLINNV